MRPPSVCLAALLLLAPTLVRAQETGAEQPPETTPPALVEFVSAAHPPGLETRGASVLLELTIGSDGAVRDARVVEPAGDGFDELALEAARRFRFQPATRGGAPIAARIRYRYVFEAIEDVPTETETVVVGEDGEEIPEAEEAASEEEPEATEPTEEEAPESELAQFEATARAEPPPREATRRVLEREVLTRMPGTRGDALRVVELLPGVARPPFGGGQLIVRGAAPGDSQVFLDGNPVPLLYHFGGLTSFYNSQLLERIEFVPGNFSVRYGRKLGGILEVDPRDPRTDGYHGFIDLNVIDASFMVEGPITPELSFAVAARRSYVDFFFDQVVPDDAFGVLAAPVYWDWQAILTWRPTSRDRIRVMGYGSSDQLRLLFGGPGGNDPAVRGNFGIETEFHRIQVGWRHVTDDFEQDLQVGWGQNDLRFGIGDSLSLNGEFWPLNIRNEWRIHLAPNVTTIAGLDMQITPLSLSFRGPQPTQGEGMPAQSVSGSTPVSFSTGNVLAYRPGAYVETDVTIAEVLDLVVGVRADYYREIGAWTADPRTTFRVRVNDEWAVRGGVGLFSQPPEFSESAEGVGNPELDPTRALHTGLGVDLRLRPLGLSFTLDGFYKHIWDRVVSTAGSNPPFFENAGLGRIYGMEFGVRATPGGPVPIVGFLSYTLMRSERQDRPDQEWRLFDFDQTHIFTLAAVWTIGDGWEAGATFRLVSGNPYTPVVGGINDLSTGTWRPIYGAVNSERNPLFHRLDVRVQKRWQIGDVGLILYLDIQNVYNATNREGVSYSYDYSQSADIPGLPIIPSLGLRGEL